MSKSVGNVIVPAKVIKQFGADILRLWVCICRLSGRCSCFDDILNKLRMYRKIRNTFRFMLGKLS